MHYLIVTGMSGAGKTSAIHALEDLGYYCVDNLPPTLIPRFVELWRTTPGNEKRAAFGVDIRSWRYFDQLSQILAELKEKGIQVEVLYMDCRDEELIRRYKTTRRMHPLQASDPSIHRLEEALALERKCLEPMRAQADYVMDTSDVNVWQNRRTIQDLFGDGKARPGLKIQLLSFGFSRGIPADCDLVLDVRFLPNPYYLESLREHTGEEECVREYVMQDGNGQIFLDKLLDMLEFLIPLYEKEGKSQLVIGIGCTGGRHRSVSMAILVEKALKEKGRNVSCYHRDIVRRG